MKTVFFIISILFFVSSASGQSDSWKIYFNKKLLLNTTQESETKNVVKIKSADLKKAGQLSIMFVAGSPNKDWRRTIAIFDDKDSTLYEKTGVTGVRVANARIKKMIAGKTMIKIYTWALPKDPNKAALVRIRRVHLCTLVLE